MTLAQTNLQLQQLLMKNALSRTLVDPRLADAEVIPTSTMQLPQRSQSFRRKTWSTTRSAIAPNWRKPASILEN